MRRILYIISISLFVGNIAAQRSTRAKEWLKYRNEFIFGIGSSHFLGDLGGRDKIGQDYTPADLDLQSTRMAVSAGHRYKIKKWMNVTNKLSYIALYGNDALTNEKYRNNRNLNFKNNLFEYTGTIEFGYVSSRIKSKYSVKRTLTQRMSNRTWSAFAYTGIGVFYHNPKGKVPDNGAWVKLRPLHTEGQGLAGGPKQYKRVSVNIPLGAYFKFTYHKVWTVALDVCIRKTFTDYIDDVGSNYYNPAALRSNFGDLSMVMSDPNKGNIAGFSSPAADGSPAVRGDNNKDTYFTVQVTAGYVLKKRNRKKARLRSKF